MKTTVRSMILLAVLALGLATAAQAEEMRTIQGALGAEVRVPAVVPDRDRYAPAGAVLVGGDLVVLLFTDPEDARRVAYAEAYDLGGNLLWIAWSDVDGEMHLVADENLEDPNSKGSAGILRLREVSGSAI